MLATLRKKWVFKDKLQCTGKTLNIGCGSRRYLPDTADIVNIDLHGRGPGTFIINDATALAFQNGCFDNVLLLDVLEHVADDGACIAEIHRVLKPGGLLFLCTPCTDGGFLYLPFPSRKGLAEMEAEWGHVRRGYTTAELRRLTGLRFTVEHSERFNATFAVMAYSLYYNRDWRLSWERRRMVRAILLFLIQLDRFLARDTGTAIFMILRKCT